MKEKLIIVGTSTTAKHLYEFVKGYDLYEVLGFAVDEQYKKADTFCELPLYSIEQVEQIFDKNSVKLFVAVLWNRLNADRRHLYERLKSKGYNFANIISPTAIIRGKLSGDNCWIHDYVVIQPEAEIKEDSMLMAFSLVGYSSIVGPHCFMGTKSTVAGKCVVGNQSFVGMNCTIFDNTVVGEKCILGACSVVKRNVESFSIVKTDTNSMVSICIGEETIETKLLFEKNVR